MSMSASPSSCTFNCRAKTCLSKPKAPSAGRMGWPSGWNFTGIGWKKKNDFCTFWMHVHGQQRIISGGPVDETLHRSNLPCLFAGTPEEELDVLSRRGRQPVVEE